MNILNLKRIFYLFITLAFVGILATSCEKAIVIEDDLDGVKEITIEDDLEGVKEVSLDEDVIKALEEGGVYSDTENGITFFVEKNVTDFNDFESNIEQIQDLREKKSSGPQPCNPKVLQWVNEGGVDKIRWNSTPSYSLFIRYFSSAGYRYSAQINTPFHCSTFKTSVTHGSYICKKTAFVGYPYWGSATDDDC